MQLAVDCPPETSRSSDDDVIGLVGGVVDRSEDVLAFEEGVISEDFVKGGACPEKFQHIGDAKVLSANAGTAPALAFFDRNSVQALKIHKIRSIHRTPYLAQRQRPIRRQRIGGEPEN